MKTIIKKTIGWILLHQIIVFVFTLLVRVISKNNPQFYDCYWFAFILASGIAFVIALFLLAIILIDI